MTTNVTNVKALTLIKDNAGRVFFTHANQSVLIPDLSAPVRASSVIQRTLIVTEAPPGTKNVGVGNVFTSALVYEGGGSSSSSGTTQTVLIVTEAAPPADSTSASGVSSLTLIVDPASPPRASATESQTLIQTEAPILDMNVLQVGQLTLAKDLNIGILSASGAASQTLILTEPKSVDPTRAKILTVHTTSKKDYESPLNFAVPYRFKIMVHNVAALSKFKNPTVVAANYRAAILVTQHVQVRSYRDPSGIAASYQTPILATNIAKAATFPAKVISDATARSVNNIVASALQAPNPQDMQSPTDFAQLMNLSVSPITLTDPVDLRPAYRFSANHVEVATKTTLNDPSEIFSYNTVLQSATLTASPTVYEPNIQSSTTTTSYNMVVASPALFVWPDDPQFRPYIRTASSKYEAAQRSSWPDPATQMSSSKVVQIAIQRSIAKNYLTPALVVSDCQVQLVATGAAHRADFVDPGPVEASGRGHQLQYTIALSVEDYNIWPIASITATSLTSLAAERASFRDPNSFFPSAMVLNESILVATSALYERPTQRLRRTSSATTTRIKH